MAKQAVPCGRQNTTVPYASVSVLIHPIRRKPVALRCFRSPRLIRHSLRVHR